MLAGLGIKRPAENAPMRPYIDAAEDWLAEHMTALASVAGGHVGDGPGSIVASAAMQLASSRYLFDRGVETGDPDLLKRASALANDSRQNVLAAYELAVREAEARHEDDDQRVQRERLETARMLTARNSG